MKFYSKFHTWFSLGGSVGVTAHAIEELGEVTFAAIEAKDGDKVKAGDVVATIESAKACAEVKAPVDGVVVRMGEPLKLNVLTEYPENTSLFLLVTNGGVDGLMNADVCGENARGGGFFRRF